MKVSAILEKKKQAEEQSASKSNPLLVSFKDGEEYRIRFIPNKEVGEMGAVPVWLHYPSEKIVSKPMVSPLTFGEPDPILDFVKTTIDDGNLSKEDFKSVASKAPKLAYFVPCVIRGHEDEGVKFLQLSGGSRFNSIPWANEGQWGRITELIEALSKEEDGDCDIADLKAGYDLIVKVTGKDKSSTGYRAFDYHLARKATPLGTKEQVTKILQNQPSWKDVYPLATAEYLQVALDKHFSAGNDTPDMDEEEDALKTASAPSTVYNEEDIQRQAEEAFKNVGVPSDIDGLDDLDSVAENVTTSASTDEEDFSDIDF